jgi:hypothetical protein
VSDKVSQDTSFERYVFIRYLLKTIWFRMILVVSYKFS